MEGRLLLVCVGLFSCAALGLAGLILAKVFAPELAHLFGGAL
jgi:hypothetical protein